MSRDLHIMKKLNYVPIVCLMLTLLMLAGCGMQGHYRGSEPFGRQNYSVAPPPAYLSRTIDVVVMTLEDNRPAMEHNLDWTRQSSNWQDNKGQPADVRNDFERAMLAGLGAHRSIRLISPETFLQTRSADLIISGAVLRCEANRLAGWNRGYFLAESEMEILLRNGRGKPLWKEPRRFTSSIDRDIVGDGSKTLDGVRVGIVANAVEDSIAEVVEKFLANDAFVRTLESLAKAK